MLDIDLELHLGSTRLQPRLQLHRISIAALFGPSGSGKTSLINAIAGLLRPVRGHIRIDGAILFDSTAGVDVPVHQRRIGYVFQEGRLFPHMSVAANLDYGRRRNPQAAAIDRARIIELLGLGALLTRRPAQLSGGERQRVAIGRALLANPRLLLLDEPMASLDAARKAEIMPYLRRLQQQFQLPMLLVTHSRDEVLQLAEQLILLDAGMVVIAGPLAEIMTHLPPVPWAAALEPGAIIAAEVLGHDSAAGTTELAFSGGRLKVAALALEVGAAVRLRVPARDVVLATQRLEGLSISNQLMGTVVRIEPGTEGLAQVAVRVGTEEILAQVMHASVTRLALAAGMPVYVLIKAVSLDPAHIARL